MNTVPKCKYKFILNGKGSYLDNLHTPRGLGLLLTKLLINVDDLSWFLISAGWCLYFSFKKLISIAIRSS